jgi:hypothetical protein
VEIARVESSVNPAAALSSGANFEDTMFTLVMLSIACAAIIGFCVMFALFTREWNDH